jgi:superfamily I DNA/RNA helicase
VADTNRPGFPQGVLAVTFTNKAAKELLTRCRRCCRSIPVACG